MLPLLLVAAQLPRPIVPDGWGVNVHFTDERPGEVAKIAGAFRWVRMDLNWAGTERRKGEYDFSAYDRLLSTLDAKGIRAYLILDYGNDLYEKGSPRSPESRTAFARWAAAAVARYKGRGVVWEMWNEPNIGFWQPKPSVEEYVALAKATGEAIRRVGPKETFVGPATSGFDWPFLQRCLDAGLLRYWDAVSVHPYRQTEPETVEADWLRLRAALDRAAPGRNVPMISGEWGYSELYAGQTKARQAEEIARQYLVNLTCGVPISVWYDWRDDGTDPEETEHHFGTVSPDLAPKPAYVAATGLAEALAGFSFVTRLHAEDPRRWILLFRRKGREKLVAWTTADSPTPVRLAEKTLTLTGRPLVVEAASNALAALAPAPWSRLDPLALTDRQEFASFIDAGGTRLARATRVLAAKPLGLTIRPNRDGSTGLQIENPFGRGLDGLTLRFQGGDRLVSASERPVTGLSFPVPEGALSVRLSASRTRYFVQADVPRFVPFPLEGAVATADGDAKVRASVAATTTDDGVRLDYDFDPGWRFAELHPSAAKVGGWPAALGMWVLGNGSGDLLRMRYTDATGQTFQPDAGPIDWTGWRYVRFPIDGSGGRWGGANDGVVHFPVAVGTAALVDMPGGRGGKGSITVARPVLEYARG